MHFDALRSPGRFLAQNGISADQDWLREYEAWFEGEGQGISDAVDRAGTPWLRMFDRFGVRVDEILYPPDYWRMLKQGYRAGVLWRAFEQNSLTFFSTRLLSMTPAWRVRIRFLCPQSSRSRNTESPI
jgi:acyl-CoA dehydrogenase